MTDKRIIYPTDSGGIAVIIPAPQARPTVLVSAAEYEDVVVPATDSEPERVETRLLRNAVYRDQTDEELLSWVAAKDVPAGLPYRIVHVDDIPTDRRWRAAWTADFAVADGVGGDFGAGTDWAVTAYDDTTGRPATAVRRSVDTGQVIAVRNLITGEEHPA